MTDADDFFGHKKVDKKKKKEKELEESNESIEEEGEWYIEDPDKKPDRVAFVRVHSDHDVTTKAS